MATVTRQPDPRREQLRRQAILRRQAVMDRLAGTRLVVVGVVAIITFVLVGYLDATYHPRRHALGGTGSTGSGNTGYGVISNSYGGGAGGGAVSGGGSVYGGGSPPSSSSGGGVVISGGS